MRTSSIRAIRRVELSRAAFEAVIRYGLRKTTLEKVGDIAGVSKGVVLHHFKDKSAFILVAFAPVSVQHPVPACSFHCAFGHL